jgi:hypothetical protein
LKEDQSDRAEAAHHDGGRLITIPDRVQLVTRWYENIEAYATDLFSAVHQFAMNLIDRASTR